MLAKFCKCFVCLYIYVQCSSAISGWWPANIHWSPVGTIPCQPLWPNGQGTGLLNQGLWVRVPPRVFVIVFVFFSLFFFRHSVKVVLDLGCGTGILSLFCAKLGNARKVGILNINYIINFYVPCIYILVLVPVRAV